MRNDVFRGRNMSWRLFDWEYTCTKEQIEL